MHYQISGVRHTPFSGFRLTRKLHKMSIQAKIASIKQFISESAPQKLPLPPALLSLRQKAQSNPYIKQIISGSRKSTFSNHYLPKDLLIRIKSKTKNQPKAQRTSPDAKIICIDELETYSRAIGMSYYFPQRADGLFAGLTDLSLQRNIKDIGWFRKDIVEHCARILRLRIISSMHRSVIELARHRDVPNALEVPLPGKKSPMEESRLDLIRKAVRRRIMVQDSEWLLHSPYIKLNDHVENSDKWMIADILPPSGLQCIIKLPDCSSIQKLSVSSEQDAKFIWKKLAQSNALDFDILDQSGASWISYLIACAPESGKEPTLSIKALEYLYHYLPNICSEKLVVHDNGAKLSRKRARRLREQLTSSGQEDAVQAELTNESSQMPTICSRAVISFNFSTNGSGSQFAVSQGTESKTVPVYDASAIFGSQITSTVINWLLSNTGSSSNNGSRYIGVVALPCTVDLAAQLDRLNIFVGK